MHKLIHRSSDLELGHFNAADFSIPAMHIESHRWSGFNSLSQPVAISRVQVYVQLSGLHITKSAAKSTYSAQSTAGTYVINPVDYARLSSWNNSRFCVITIDSSVEDNFLAPNLLDALAFGRGTDPILFNLGLHLNVAVTEAGGAFHGQSILQAIFRRITEIQRIETNNKAIGKRSIRAILDYIDQNATNDIDLTSLAEFGSCSSFHLVKAFKNATGNTPYGYVLQKRIELAMTLLARTHLPIESIGIECGFTSSSQFSRIFRSRVGMSASEFRRRS